MYLPTYSEVCASFWIKFPQNGSASVEYQLLQHGLVVPSLLVALFKYTFLLAALAVKNFMAFQDRLGHAAFDVGAQLFAAVGPFDFKQLFLELR